MAWKIPFFEEVPEFKPRTKFGLREDLPTEQRAFLDAFDVMEQRMEYSMKVGVRGHNFALIAIVLLILTNGPKILGIVQTWLGEGVSQKVTVAEVSRIAEDQKP